MGQGTTYGDRAAHCDASKPKTRDLANLTQAKRLEARRWVIAHGLTELLDKERPQDTEGGEELEPFCFV